jgi:NTE family protein
VHADLVLEGGGVKGIGLVGALAVLEEAGYQFSKVAGTSAGAIVGALVAADMSTGEMREEMRTLRYDRFRDKGVLDRLGPVGRLASVVFEGGIYEGRYLIEWLEGQLAKKGVDTFAQLVLEDPGTSLPPDRRSRLVVMASDLSHGRLRRLPWDYQPCYRLDGSTRKVSEAVRASMSIPFFYEPFYLQCGPPEGQSKGERVCLVDGGMLSNFPVNVFDRPTGERPRWPTFGIKLSAKPTEEHPPVDISGPLGLTKGMIRTLTGFYDGMHLDDPGVCARTIFVDTTGVKATDFDIDRRTQDRLYENGQAAARKFLDSWDFDTYIEQYRTVT